MILISPSEPAELRSALKATNSALCEQLGADILAPTDKGLVGLQRKTVSDFIASLEDGRLAREIPLLTCGVTFPMLLLEGGFTFIDDHLCLNGRFTRYTKQGVNNLMRSLNYVNGIAIERSVNLAETPSVVNELIAFMGKEHKSLLKRPKLQGAWGRPSAHEALGYFYQGLPGVGVVLSQSLMKAYPSPSSLTSASFDNLKALPQIGKQRAEKIYVFLHKEHRDDN